MSNEQDCIAVLRLDHQVTVPLYHGPSTATQSSQRFGRFGDAHDKLVKWRDVECALVDTESVNRASTRRSSIFRGERVSQGLMSVALYRESLLEFVKQKLLHGNGEGLTSQTRLIELGIIDSFSLCQVLAFVQSEFGVDLLPEEAEAVLRDVDALAEAIHKRRSAP